MDKKGNSGHKMTVNQCYKNRQADLTRTVGVKTPVMADSARAKLCAYKNNGFP